MYNDMPHRLLRFQNTSRDAAYLMEKQEKDGLGDPRWVRDWEFATPRNDTSNNRHDMLLRLVESLVLADKQLEAAHRLGGWEAVSVIQVDRGRKNTP